MGVHASSGPMATQAPGQAVYEETYGAGWLVFAGTMLLMVGCLNIVYGIGAISDSKFFVNNAQYVFSNLNTWGWIALLTGAAQVLTAFGIWARNTLATWAGIGFASVNAVVQLLMIPAYPFLALALFAIDLLVIYGLAVHGGHAEAA